MKQQILPALSALCLLPFSVLASGPGDQHWDNHFGSPGINGGNVNEIAIVGNTIYAGGVIAAAGNTRANGVAGFDGTNWFPLNAGLLNLSAVTTLNADGNNLYAGGIFTNADDSAAFNAARWDGTSWSHFGINGLLYAVKRNGTNLYFVGSFSSAGGVAATNIARWDGTNWFALGLSVSGTGYGFSGGIACVAIQGNNIYVGGSFSFAGGSSATNVAYWDGSSWHAMGNPFNGVVYALQFFGPYLYAAGTFTNTSLLLTNIARWDGSVWSAVPGGGANNLIYDLATNSTRLFVGGSFTQIGGIAATGIVNFDGASTWTPMGGVFGFQGGASQVTKMVWQSNQLYVAGFFERAGNTGACCVARWDGANWSSLGGTTSKGGEGPSVNQVNCLLQVNNSVSIQPGLYMGGLFTSAGSTVGNCITRWDGTTWNAVGGGVSGNFSGAANGQRILAIATNSTALYAGGIFTSAGGVSASGVAYWDGSNWNPMGSGVDFTVNSIVAGSGNRIWVGGQFTNAGGIYSRGLTSWSSGSWQNLGNVEGTNGIVFALAYDGGTKIYAGGQFYTAGGVNATNIACYDVNSSTWTALGPGLMRGKVSALAYANGTLYAGGTFTNAGATAVYRVAQWNGANWSALGTGIFGNGAATVNGITVSGGNVYVTGNFTNAGGVVSTNIAYWDGSQWQGMGSGLDNTRLGSTVAASGNDIYVGGNFNFAGDKSSVQIAHWNSQSNYYPAANMLLTRTLWQTNRQFKFRVNGTYGQYYIIQGSTNLNLNAWTPLQTNSTMFYDFVDTNSAAFPSRFYRAVLGP
jgi:hypothetical protein